MNENRSFLEPKLIESLNISFKQRTKSLANYKPASNIFHEQESKIFLDFKSKKTIEDICKFASILKLISSFLGYKFDASVLRVPLWTKTSRPPNIKQLSLSPTSLSLSSPRSNNPTFFNEDQQIDHEIYRNEFYELHDELKKLYKEKHELQMDLKRMKSFLDCDNDHGDYLTLSFLTYKLTAIRQASYRSKVKSVQNDYFHKMSEFRKNLKIQISNRMTWIQDELLLLKILFNELKIQIKNVLTITGETAGAAGTTVLHGENNALKKVEIYERINLFESKIEQIQLNYQQMIAPMNQLTNQYQWTPRKDIEKPVDNLQKLNKTNDLKYDLQFHYEFDENERIIHQTTQHLKDFNKELSNKMASCVKMAMDSLQKKHGSLVSVLESDPVHPVDDPLPQSVSGKKLVPNSTTRSMFRKPLERLEELETLLESVIRHRENIREMFTDSHEEDMQELNSIIIQRRITFLHRLKEQFHLVHGHLNNLRTENTSGS